MEERLKSVYYDPKHPAGFASIQKLAKATGISQRKVKTWLKEQPTYTLHRQARKRYPVRHYIVHDIDEQWQADLAEVQDIASKNQGYRYILTVIDIFSRYAWARPLKSKRGEDVTAAFRDIFQEGRIPKRIQTDQGREFENRHVRALFHEHNIELFSVKSAYKAAIVERFNRTLKHRLWRYFTSENKQEWTEVLQDAVYAYNHSVHRTIKRKPADVSADSVGEMRDIMSERPDPPQGADDIRVGDTVRISKVKSVFAKGYLPNWTEELFTVERVIRKYKPFMYKLKDYNNEVIEGSFYRYEIQPVIKKDDVYLLERIIRRQRRHGEMWCLVKWKDYPPSMNSWVRERDISEVTQRR
ncbi:MAG: DDE-type integrase/transposase/recombinase [Bacteroidota bacterium]